MLDFTSNWTQTLSGPIVAGRALTLHYDWARFYANGGSDPVCHASHNGYRGWTITVHYTFDLADPAQTADVVMTDGQTNQAIPWDPTIAIPQDATNIWLWASNTDTDGCAQWDSDFGQNYLFPVFSVAEITQPVGWVGSFNFMYWIEPGPEAKGDVDPAYYWSTMGGSELATFEQADVWVPGITDRVYQNEAVRREVAHTAIAARVVADAYVGGSPGAALLPTPLEYLYRSGFDHVGNNFVYRWFQASLLWGNQPIPDGAYSYRFDFTTAEGADVSTLGAPGDNSVARTIVLAQNTRCDLFTFNPPSDFCP